MSFSLLFLDIETTGLKPHESDLLELSAVRISPDFSQETAVFDELVFTESPIPPFVQKLTGISSDLLTDAKSFDEVHSAFRDFLKPDDIICGHNISFDVGFLCHHGYTIDNKTLDTFPLSNLFLLNEESYALEILSQKYGITHDDAHRALSDVRANVDLFRVLIDHAQKIPDSLRDRYLPFLQKSSWIGSEILLDLFTAPQKEQEITPPSLFDLSEDTEKSTSKYLEVPLLPKESERKNILQAWEYSTELLVSLPRLFSDLDTGAILAKEAHEKENNRVALALPSLHKQVCPDGFFRFASPKKVVCSSALKKWEQSRDVLDPDETVALLKLVRQQEMGLSLFLSDIPLMWEERSIAKQWISEDHTHCPSDCPAKHVLLQSAQKKLFFCDYEDLSLCPAESVVLLQSELLARDLDRHSRQKISFNPLESWLSKQEEDEFISGLFFGIGLLKRWVREQVGEGKYQKNHTLSSDSLSSQEIVNLQQGFQKAYEQSGVRNIPPQIRETLRSITDFLSDSLEENECRFATIYPSEDLIFHRSFIDLKGQLDFLLQGKTKRLFFGSNFLKKQGGFQFGDNLPTPSEQIIIDSPFDFPKKSQLILPEFGGNTKYDTEEKTVRLVCDFLDQKNDIPGNILLLFPSQALAEKAAFALEQKAEEKKRSCLIVSGSRGKIMGQISRGDALIIATANTVSKIDFSRANISSCFQHRLFFDPPPDPVQNQRHSSVSDEFLEVSLPRARQRFLEILEFLTLANRDFSWFCLDAHFQKREGFTDTLLADLPASLPVKKCDTRDILRDIPLFKRKKKSKDNITRKENTKKT